MIRALILPGAKVGMQPDAWSDEVDDGSGVRIDRRRPRCPCSRDCRWEREGIHSGWRPAPCSWRYRRSDCCFRNRCRCPSHSRCPSRFPIPILSRCLFRSMKMRASSPRRLRRNSRSRAPVPARPQRQTGSSRRISCLYSHRKARLNSAQSGHAAREIRTCTFSIWPEVSDPAKWRIFGELLWYALLRFGQEFVFVDHRGHGHFTVAIVDSYHFSFAAHADAFGEGDFGRKS